VRGQVIGIVANHLKPGAFHKVPNVSDGAFRRLALKVDLELLARVAKADCLGRVPGNFDCTAMEWFVERARALGVEHGAPKPFVLGRHVLAHGVTPGPHVGVLLKQIYEMQLDGRITNVEEGLVELEKLLRASH
jgi:tRNA nucleotidyltransferase (CCA-adding enzyme)